MMTQDRKTLLSISQLLEDTKDWDADMVDDIFFILRDAGYLGTDDRGYAMVLPTACGDVDENGEEILRND